MSQTKVADGTRPNFIVLWLYSVVVECVRQPAKGMLNVVPETPLKLRCEMIDAVPREVGSSSVSALCENSTASADAADQSPRLEVATGINEGFSLPHDQSSRARKSVRTMSKGDNDQLFNSGMSSALVQKCVL